MTYFDIVVNRFKQNSQAALSDLYNYVSMHVKTTKKAKLLKHHVLNIMMKNVIKMQLVVVTTITAQKSTEAIF